METEARTSEASAVTDWKKYGLKALRGLYFTLVVIGGLYLMQAAKGSTGGVIGAVAAGLVYLPTYLRQRRQKAGDEPEEDESQ